MPQIQDFSFNPPTGLNDSSYSPTTPTSEAAIREQLQGIPDQLRDYINILLARLHSQTLGSSGSEEIASATISGVTGNTVYQQLANIYLQIGNIVLGQIPNGSLTTEKIDLKFKSDISGSKIYNYKNIGGAL